MNYLFFSKSLIKPVIVILTVCIHSSYFFSSRIFSHHFQWLAAEVTSFLAGITILVCLADYFLAEVGGEKVRPSQAQLRFLGRKTRKTHQQELGVFNQFGNRVARGPLGCVDLYS